ncbi:MAG: hypothetical protein ACKVP7_07420 [Hyphomicrobiaceae bacterium]
MPKTLKRQPQEFTVDEYLSDDTDLPEKMELWDGEIGPFSDTAKLALLANWGADKIVALTGPAIWLEAAKAAAKSE